MASGSIKKEENGTYSFVVDVGKNGIRKQVRRRGFEKKKQAQDALTALLNEVNNDNYMKQSDMSIDTLIEMWIKDKKADNTMSKITVSNNRSYAKNHISPTIGSIKLDKLEKKHLIEFVKTLRSKKSRNGIPFSDSTIQRAYIVLVAALNYAKEEKLIKENIADKKIRPKIIKRKLDVWNVYEVNLFLNSMKKSRYYIAYFLAINTGMRQSEILGLPWSNVDLKNKVIRVTQTLERDGKSIKHSTKTISSLRSISISDDVVLELEKHKALLDEEKKYFDNHFEFNLVVCKSNGTSIFAETITRIMRKKISELKLRPIRFHDLRHTFASLLLQSGSHPKVVQEMLGHTSITMTLDTYSHLLPNMQHEAVKGLSSLLNNTD